MEQTICPEFAFHWPELSLLSCSTAARSFLPPFEAGSSTAGLEADIHQLRFDHLFLPTTPPTPGEDWIALLIKQCSMVEFGSSVTIQPRYFPHACATTVFLTGDQDAPVRLRVLLLRPMSQRKLQRDQAVRAVSMTQLSDRHGTQSFLPSQAGHSITVDEAFGTLGRLAQRSMRSASSTNSSYEEQLPSLVNDLPEMAFIAYAAGEAVWFNQRWYEYTGLSPELAVDEEAWRSVLHSDDVDRASMIWQTAEHTCQMFQFDCRIRGADGNMRWFMCKVRPLSTIGRQGKQWLATVYVLPDLAYCVF